MFHTGKNFTTDVLGEGKRTKLGGILSNLIVSDSIERNYTASVYLQQASLSKVQNYMHHLLKDIPVKGTVSRDFQLLVFFIRAVSNLFKNSRRYSQLKV